MRKHRRLNAGDVDGLMVNFKSIEFFRCMSGVSCYANDLFVGSGKTASLALGRAMKTFKKGGAIGR